MDGALKGKMLSKLLELFSGMPDKEDIADGGADEAKEGHPKGAELSIIGLGAKPLPHDHGIKPMPHDIKKVIR